MPTAAAPLYFRIQEMLRRQILSGRLGVGTRVPSESELAKRFETTRGTVRQALAHLTFEGLIERRVGLGTFVAPRRLESRIEAARPRSFEEQMEEAGARVAFRLLEFEAQPASKKIATALGIAPGEQIFRLRRLRFVDGNVVGYEDRALLERLGANIRASALAHDSAVVMTESALGAPLGGISVSVGAELARADVAALLEIRKGAPVLVRTHVFFDAEAKPLVAGEAIYRGDRYRFTYRFGNAP
ncbi:MAG: GntR family transcriptional regulator [Candidatus Eremiobacteraeota bacterium]|nr:GntR family transcriptional regulator [Candidatus Eremiobacteraeota bacterium]